MSFRYIPQSQLTLPIDDLLEIPSLRPKVKRVIKLDKLQRARLPGNPFKLNKKDFRQLAWIERSYIPKFFKLFPVGDDYGQGKRLLSR